jgi:hypothetical protein
MSFPDTSAPPRSQVPDADGSLIRWMLGLSPAERLQVLQSFVDSVSEMRRDQSAAVQGRT